MHYFSVAGEDTGGRTGQHSNVVSVTISGKYYCISCVLVYYVFISTTHCQLYLSSI